MYHLTRRPQKQHRVFNPVISDDLDSDDYYEDDYRYFPQNTPPAYWHSVQPPYGGQFYPPQAVYPAPYPHPPYPYPPAQQHFTLPPNDYPPRNTGSNFGILMAAVCTFAIIVFGAVWYTNAHDKNASVVREQTYLYQTSASDPSLQHRRRLRDPKPYLQPITKNTFAVWLQTFESEAAVERLKVDLRMPNIITVQMGDGYWACILPEDGSETSAYSERDELIARYQWNKEPIVFNLRSNCDGLEWQGNKLVCGEQ